MDDYKDIDIIETTMGHGMTCNLLNYIKAEQDRTGLKVYSNFKLDKRYGIKYELLDKEVLK